MSINVRSVYHLTMLCVPHLIATRWNIVNVSSLLGTRAGAAADAYTPCRRLLSTRWPAALHWSLPPSACESTASTREWPSPIFANEVELITGDTYTKFMEHNRETRPLGRVGDPEDTANAIVFLASSNASFVTGEHFHVDGGYQAACFRWLKARVVFVGKVSEGDEIEWP